MTAKEFDFEVERGGFVARVSWPWLILSFFTFFGLFQAVFWLYSDVHNDARYISREQYTIDQSTLRRELDVITKKQDLTLDYLIKLMEKNK